MEHRLSRLLAVQSADARMYDFLHSFASVRGTAGEDVVVKGQFPQQ